MRAIRNLRGQTVQNHGQGSDCRLESDTLSELDFAHG